jgi:rod shape-determining protein MreC
MRGLIHLIYKYHLFLLFLSLQFICFLFIFNFNRFHKVIFINSTNSVIGSFYEKRSGAAEYLHLRELNDSLSRENSRLKAMLPDNFSPLNDGSILINDTVYKQRYSYLPAKVINSSANRLTNFITLDRGSILGVEGESGVVSGNAVVGVVKEVSPHFSVVMPIINTNFTLSVKLRSSQDFGQLTWDGEAVEFAQVDQLSKHLFVGKGDTLVTTGYSSYFPEGVIVGFVESVSNSDGSDFQSARIRLATSYKSLTYVQIVKHLMKLEQNDLEQLANDQYGEDSH